VHDQKVTELSTPSQPDGPPHPLPRVLVRAADISWRLLVIGALAFFVVAGITRIVPVLIALFIAALLSAVLHPAAAWLSKYIWRSVAVGIVIVVFVALLAAAVAFISTSVAGEWHTLWLAIQKGIFQVERWLRRGPFHLSQADLQHLIKTVETWISSRTSTLLQLVARSAGSILDVITALLTGVFALIFFMLEPRKLFDWFLSWVPARSRLRTDEAATLAWQSFSGYTRGIIVVALSDSIVVGIGLAIIGVPLVGPLALLVFFGAFIPVIGAPIAMIIAALVALAAKGPLAAALVIGLVFIVGELEGHVFQPLILGKAVQLHPLAIVLIVTVGTAVSGFVGALVAVPVVVVIYTVLKYLTDRLPSHPRAPLGSPDVAFERAMHDQLVLERAKAEHKGRRSWRRKTNGPDKK